MICCNCYCFPLLFWEGFFIYLYQLLTIYKSYNVYTFFGFFEKMLYIYICTIVYTMYMQNVYK